MHSRPRLPRHAPSASFNERPAATRNGSLRKSIFRFFKRICGLKSTKGSTNQRRVPRAPSRVPSYSAVTTAELSYRRRRTDQRRRSVRLPHDASLRWSEYNPVEPPIYISAPPNRSNWNGAHYRQESPSLPPYSQHAPTTPFQSVNRVRHMNERDITEFMYILQGVEARPDIERLKAQHGVDEVELAWRKYTVLRATGYYDRDRTRAQNGVTERRWGDSHRGSARPPQVAPGHRGW